MPTKYNLNLSMEKSPEDAPPELYNQTCELYQRLGLLGKKHANHFGRIFNGYDDDGDLVRIGRWEVNYRENMTFSSVEMLEQSELKTSGDDELGMEINEHARGILSFLGRFDPTALILPWNIYASFPLISSMELQTPLGRQSMHAHTEDKNNIDFGVIQFWKPQKDKHFYSFDILKNYLFDAFLVGSDLSDKLCEEKLRFFQRLSVSKRAGLLRRAGDLYEKLMMDPDSVKKLPGFVRDIGVVN